MRRLIEYRELLWVWTIRDIRSRYKQTVLGGMWAVLQPLALMVMFSVIFSLFIKVSTEGVPYPIFSYSGLLFWIFFSTSVIFASNSLVNNMTLLRKIYFPREILPFAAVAASFVDLLIASTVFIGLIVYFRVPISISVLWVGPLLLLQIALTLGVVLFSSALNVFYRDFRFIVPLGIQLWMFATPVIYPVSIIPAAVRPYLVFNPMMGIIEGYRTSILHGVTPDWSILWPGAVVTILILFAGFAFFRRVEWAFADVI